MLKRPVSTCLCFPAIKNLKPLFYPDSSSHLSFAKPEYMKMHLDITPGFVSIPALMNDAEYHIQLLIDRDAMQKQEYFPCHPYVNTSSIKYRTRDLLEKLLPAMGHSYIVVDLPGA